jgi:hypothetical protein
MACSGHATYSEAASSSHRDVVFIERKLQKILLAPEERNVNDRIFIVANVVLRWSATG